jgi:hypothetical protein
MLEKWFSNAYQVLNFSGQQFSVLVSNLFRRAFQMHVDPTIPLESIAALHAVILRNGWFPLR